MTESLRQKLWRFAATNFPERQIYIRSEGRVQFFSLSPMTQAIMAGTGLLALGWVAFTSVNTVFKDRIIAVKESHFREAQASYENRLANLQSSYDELNRALVDAEDRFKAVADDLEARHRTLATIVEGKASLQASLGPATVAPPPAKAASGSYAARDGIGGSLYPPVPAASLRPIPRAVKAPSSARDTVPATSKTTGPHSMLKGAGQKIGALFGSVRAALRVNHPAFRSMEGSEARLERLAGQDSALLAAAETSIERDVAKYRQAMRVAGIDPKKLASRAVPTQGGVGGPELPVAFADGAFEDQALKALASLDEFGRLVRVLRAVPLSAPVLGASFDQSSGFGLRPDPFTNRLSFHSGLDFSGPLGSPVLATASGTVVFAGVRGAFGNTIEIDHGYGVRTRYGHLQRILAKVGSQVQKGAIIGKLGSSGRSTGPHVHYEVWYDDAVKNPSNFLKAGHYVYQDQGT